MRSCSRHLIHICLFALSLLTLHSADKIKQEPIHLKTLPGTDSLEIQYTISGCFQLQRYSVHFTQDKIEITELHLPALPRAPIVFDRTPLGSLRLSQKEIDGLDLMLSHYRIGNNLISTSSVRLQIKQMREGQILREENITYVSDDQPPPEGLLDLYTLIKHLKALKDVPAT